MSSETTHLPKELDWSALGTQGLTLFQNLLRFDTTNPPGNEHLATDYLAEILRKEGLEPWVAESAPGRSNLVVRLPATHPGSTLAPLLLAGHTDVVPARAEEWTHPPFGGVIDQDMLWGRGAVDMKNMVAMSVMALLTMKRHMPVRHRDVIVAAVADEEEGCTFGSSWLVNEHKERVQAEYMIGEVGGFWLNFGQTTYIPIMVAEKGRAHLRLKTKGQPGHGSLPDWDNALARLNLAAHRLGTTPLPYHLTPAVEQFIRGLAAHQPLPTRLGLLGLLHARTAPKILETLIRDKDQSRAFFAMLHNTATPTMMRAGQKLNTIADQAECEVDARLLPGQSLLGLLREVRQVIDDATVEVDVVDHWPGSRVASVQTPVYDAITEVVGQRAPGAVCVPYMITGFTDAKAFGTLGTTCYGFSPMKLDPRHDLSFSKLFHGVDERIPVDGFLWGVRVLTEVVAKVIGQAA